MDQPRGRRVPPVPAWLPVLALLAVLLTAYAASRAGYAGFSASRVAFWWIAGMLLVLATACWVDGHAGRLAFPRRLPGRSTVLRWTGMIVLAAVPRLAMLDRFPTVMDADEGAFMRHAVQFLDGDMPNPFTTGYFSTPLLYLAAQGIIAAPFGDDISAFRLLSAILGIAGILATWRLGIRVAGPTAGLLAGVLLAGMPLHLYFSRSGLNNITDPTFLIVTLLFLARAVEGRRATDGVVAGLALAASFYGYYGGRAMWAVALVSMLALAVTGRYQPWTAARAAGWTVAAFVAGATPLLMAYRANPAEFGGHIDMVRPTTGTSSAASAFSAAGDWLGRLLDALRYPVAGNETGFLRREPPFIGWPLTILVIVGILALVGRGVVRRDGRAVALLAVPYVLLCAGISLTEPLASQRFSAVMPLLAIVAGAGLAWMSRLATNVSAIRSPRVWQAAALAIALMVGVANVRWLASEDRQLETYGDVRTTMMWDIGWRLREGGEGTARVLIAGAPYVFAYGFPNLTFLAPDVAQEDILGQFLPGIGAPPLPDGTILVLVPERTGERCAVEAAYPGATVGEGRDRYGNLLYVAFSNGELRGWSVEETPAGTTWSVAADSGC